MDFRNEIVRQLPQFAAKIQSSISRIDEGEMESVVHSLQVFLANQYSENSEQLTPKEFIELVWQSIPKEHAQSVIGLIIMGALRKVNIGTKMQRATFLEQEVLHVPAISDKLFWTYFEKIASWAVRYTVKQTTETFLAPFVKILVRDPTTINESEKVEQITLVMRIVSWMAQCFPNIVDENRDGVKKQFLEGVKIGSRQLLVIMKETFEKASNVLKKIAPHVCVSITVVFNGLIRSGGQCSNAENIKDLCDFADSLVHVEAACAKVLKFETSPYQLLLSKEPHVRNIAFALYPFYVKYLYNAKDVTPEVKVATTKAFMPLIKRKVVGRNEALIGLGNYLFARRVIEQNEMSLLKPVKKKLESQVEDEPAVFCLCAILSVIEQKCSSCYNLLANAPLSLTLADAFRKMCEVQPNEKEFFCEKLVAQCIPKLLDVSTSAKDAIMVFSCLERMEVPISTYSPVLVLNLSVWMYDSDASLRKLATDFVLEFQEKSPSLDVFQRILAVISTEPNGERRAQILQRVRKEPCHASIVPMLEPLLQDPCQAVRKECIRILASMSHVPDAGRVLGAFLSEKARDIGAKSGNTKASIKYFSTAFSETDSSIATRQLVIPVADFLVQNLLDTQATSTNAIRLLAQLLRHAPEAANMKKLKTLIGSVLSIHSTESQIDAAVDLLQAALDVTDLKVTIYTDDLDIVVKLLDLAKNKTSYGDRFLRLLTSIGPIDPEGLRSLQTKHQSEQVSGVSNTPNCYFADFDPKQLILDIKKSCESMDEKKAKEMIMEAQPRLEALCNASVGVVLLNLLDILSEEPLAELHEDAIEAILKIFRAQRRQIGDSLEAELCKRITLMIRYSGGSTVSVLLKNLGTLILVLGERFVPLVPHVVELVCESWGKRDVSLLVRILNWLITYLPDALEPHLPKISLVLVKSLDTGDLATVSTIFTGLDLRPHLASIGHIIIPPLCQWICRHAADPGLEKFLRRFKEMLIYSNVRRFLDQVIRVALEVQRKNPQLQQNLVDILTVVVSQIETQFLFYFPQVRRAFPNLDDNFLSIVSLLEQGLDTPALRAQFQQKIGISRPQNAKDERVAPQRASGVIQGTQPRPQFQLELPDPQWQDHEWAAWSEHIFTTLIQKCVDDIRFRAISACDSLVQRHAGTRDALYPLAFARFYFDKTADTNAADVLDAVFSSPNVPMKVLRHFLAVAELIELAQNVPQAIGQKPNPKKQWGLDTVAPGAVAKAAESAQLIVQALRITEYMFDRTFREAMKMDILAAQTEKLICYNQQLGLPLAARGVLLRAAQREVRTNERLLEELGLWNEALEKYNAELASNKGNNAALEGKLRCLVALSKYKEIEECKSGKEWPLYQAAAYWGMGEDAKFVAAVEGLASDNSTNYLYYRALYHVMKGMTESQKVNFEKAKELAEQLRQNYEEDIFPAISEDYDRVYVKFAHACYATEIQESIAYSRLDRKTRGPSPEERQIARDEMSRMLKTWKMRFGRLAAEPLVMYEILRIRSLSFDISDILPEWIRFLNTAISSKKLELVEHSLEFLKTRGFSGIEMEYSQAKLSWARGDHSKAISSLEKAIKDTHESSALSGPELTLGLWLLEEGGKGKLEEARKHIQRSTVLASEPAAWKAWATVNSELHRVSNNSSYLLDSLDASLQGLSLSTDDPLPFTLKTLSILFSGPDNEAEVFSRFRQRVASIPVHVWIAVLPQIIARAKDPNLHGLIQDLIFAIGKEHPHVVLYSLMPPLKSDSGPRQKVASAIFDQLETLYPVIVHQMLAFANELIRAGVTWWELWYTQLDEASRAYITRNDVDEMYSLIAPLHEAVNRAPETIYETMFLCTYGHVISIAGQHLEKWKAEGDDYDLFQAWSLYIKIYQTTKPFVNETWSIPLEDASPKLNSMIDLDIVVPGTYAYNETPVHIHGVEPVMTVMRSKQRPRRMVIDGSDGQKYTFLLKAHEDVRLDERVMQFFALVNSLMSHSQIPLKEHMSITTYEVIPLTGQVGLIGWVPDCNTVFDLIRNLREKNNIPLEAEFNDMLRRCKEFETIDVKTDLDRKCKIFEGALRDSNGNDLREVLLLRADDSNHWLRRRTEYTTSLAMTSMAGYILGLGDRHLCNIMMKKKSAKLVHIDFGDCFEVAMHREKFPERVPFRLTRVLQNALDVSKVEGTFKTCCLEIMELMRSNSDQLIGLLEVFVYDPLLQWIESEKGGDACSQTILDRIKAKLNGLDFEPEKQYDVPTQVTRLIDEATSTRNLCQMFRGWFPWW